LAGSCSNRRWMLSACISRTSPLIISSTQNCRPSPDRLAVSVRSPGPYALGRPPHRRLSRPLRRAFEYYGGSVAMQVPHREPVQAIPQLRVRGVAVCLGALFVSVIP
jgi:hypothetical protein